MNINTGNMPFAPSGRTIFSLMVNPSAVIVFSDSSMPETSTFTEACACSNTFLASYGSISSIGGPSPLFNCFRNALTWVSKCGSVAKLTGFLVGLAIVAVLINDQFVVKECLRGVSLIQLFQNPILLYIGINAFMLGANCHQQRHLYPGWIASGQHL